MMIIMNKYISLIILLFCFQCAYGRTYYFMSYHIYTNEDNKYDEKGFCEVPSIVEIDENEERVILRLYTKRENDKGWYSFEFSISEKEMILKNDITIYLITNNIGEKGYLYISPYREGGLFIDINAFRFKNVNISCWMQNPQKVTK